MNKKHGFSFHRSFKFNRQAVSKTLDCLVKTGNIAKQHLVNNYHFGTIYAEAYPRYAIATGLIKKRERTLTSLGRYISERDPNISKVNSQWLLHYHLSNSNGNGPLFWNFLVKNLFIPNNIFSRNLVSQFLLDFNITINDPNKNSKIIKTTSSVFLRSYTEPDGFNLLNILNYENDCYRIKPSTNISCLVFYYGLIDYYSDENKSKTINIEEIIGSELKNIFILTSDGLIKIIDDLIQNNLVCTHNGYLLLAPINHAVIEKALSMIFK